MVFEFDIENFDINNLVLKPFEKKNEELKKNIFLESRYRYKYPITLANGKIDYREAPCKFIIHKITTGPGIIKHVADDGKVKFAIPVDLSEYSHCEEVKKVLTDIYNASNEHTFQNYELVGGQQSFMNMGMLAALMMLGGKDGFKPFVRKHPKTGNDSLMIPLNTNSDNNIETKFYFQGMLQNPMLFMKASFTFSPILTFRRIFCGVKYSYQFCAYDIIVLTTPESFSNEASAIQYSLMGLKEDPDAFNVEKEKFMKFVEGKEKEIQKSGQSNTNYSHNNDSDECRENEEIDDNSAIVTVNSNFVSKANNTVGIKRPNRNIASVAGKNPGMNK